MVETAESQMPRSGRSCPGDEQVAAVLDHAATAADDAHVRAHVAECERCLERHSAAFELELWGGVLAAATGEATPIGSERGGRSRRLPLMRRSGSRIAAAAAALLALIGLGAWWLERDVAAPAGDGGAAVGAAIAAPPFVGLVAEWSVAVEESGPTGSRSTRTSWTAAARDRVQVVERAVAADGVATRQERLVAREAARDAGRDAAGNAERESASELSRRPSAPLIQEHEKQEHGR